MSEIFCSMTSSWVRRVRAKASLRPDLTAVRDVAVATLRRASSRQNRRAARECYHLQIVSEERAG